MQSFADLKGKVAVLTGGTGVIGMALAAAMAQAGVRVALGSRDRAKAETVALRIAHDSGGEALGLGFDVLDAQTLQAAKTLVNQRWGPIDCLINAAGGNKPAATSALERILPENRADLSAGFFGLDLGAVNEVFQLNFTGTLLPTQIFSRDMAERGGTVINISSMSSFKPLTKVPAYSASKAAVNNLTQWLAVHLAPLDIRVNAIAPGFFLTEQNRFLLLDQDSGQPTARTQKILAGTPMGRLGSVEDLPGTLLYLMSDLSRFVTGAVIPVDGGFGAYGGV